MVACTWHKKISLFFFFLTARKQNCARKISLGEKIKKTFCHCIRVFLWVTEISFNLAEAKTKYFAYYHSKNLTLISGSCLFCGCESKTGVAHILVTFQDRPMFSHINGKLSPRPFSWCGWTWVYLEKWPNYVPPLFWFRIQNSSSIL